MFGRAAALALLLALIAAGPAAGMGPVYRDPPGYDRLGRTHDQAGAAGC